MTNQEINQQIAEVVGWTGVREYKDSDFGIVFVGYPPSTPLNNILIPNYCEDLNAMHEAEKILWIAEHRKQYSKELWKIIDPEYGCQTEGGYRLFPQAWEHVYFLSAATARQRAEAFLKTVGKWKE